MSGHSHYATIKRQKGLKDALKGNIFSKLAREITIASKSGPDPDSNFKLRVIIDKARSYNMPKENIERAISKALGGGSLDEVTYEGFAAGGVSVIVEAATDNKNRTAQEIKNLFERAGGSLGGPGSVEFNFELKGSILVEKEGDSESQILSLMDFNPDDIQDLADGIEVYTSPDKLFSTRKLIEEKGMKIKSSELIQKPTTFVVAKSKEMAKKVLAFLDSLEEQDDVAKVFANLDVPEDLLNE